MKGSSAGPGNVPGKGLERQKVKVMILSVQLGDNGYNLNRYRTFWQKSCQKLRTTGCSGTQEAPGDFDNAGPRAVTASRAAA